jgi:hypothetical protein
VATQRNALLAQVDQQAIQVITHVLHRHREGSAFDQFLQRALVELDALLHHRPPRLGNSRAGNVARV